MSDDGSNTPVAMALCRLLHEAEANANRLHTEWQLAVHRRMALRDALDDALNAERKDRLAKALAAKDSTSSGSNSTKTTAT